MILPPAEELIYSLETLDRSETWVFIACDREPDGSLRLVNAAGIYPDEWSAALAGEDYVGAWKEKMGDAPPPETFAIPIFIEAATPKESTPDG